MGLTIHYGLQLGERSIRKARETVAQLHSRALDLPFENVGAIRELSGGACDLDQTSRDNPSRWLLCQAGAWLEVEGTNFRVPPIQIIAFSTMPGPGCEPANFGLCRYPATYEVRDPSLPNKARRVRTRLAGWRWSSFCKTQYATSPECGGLKNFLKCHLAVITLLDHAKLGGLVTDVHDEGEYWEKRDVAELAREVGHWNVQIAGFAGRLKDQLGSQVLAEIANFPNFEHLEARSRAAV